MKCSDVSQVDTKNYWSSGIRYTGKKYDVANIISLSNKLKMLIVESAIQYLRSKHDNYRYVDINLLKAKLGVRVTNGRSIMYTSTEAKLALKKHKRLLEDSIEIDKDLKLIGKQIDEALGYAILEVFSTDSINLCRVNDGATNEYFSTYHDYLAHYIIEFLSKEKYYDEITELPERLRKGNEINVHTIFGNILGKHYVDLLLEGLDRRSIYLELVNRLSNYLQGKTYIEGRRGVLPVLDPYITPEEAEASLHHHRSEVPVSYYEPYIYLRYRPDFVANDDVLKNDFSDLPLVDKVKLIESIELGKKSIYQDSFYIRDEVIRTAFSTCL